MAQSGTATDSKSVEPVYAGVRVQISLAPNNIEGTSHPMWLFY